MDKIKGDKPDIEVMSGDANPAVFQSHSPERHANPFVHRVNTYFVIEFDFRLGSAATCILRLRGTSASPRPSTEDIAESRADAPTATIPSRNVFSTSVHITLSNITALIAALLAQATQSTYTVLSRGVRMRAEEEDVAKMWAAMA